MIKRALLSVSIYFLFLNMYAWKEPMKYGDVSLEELQMTTCDIDSSAEAVVLCHYGYFSSEQFTFREHIRIKILKKEGLNWANYVFYTSTKGHIKGRTYNLENNEILETKLTNESIFENRIYEDYYNFRVAMPSVKVGSVLDIECDYNGVPYFWDFQMSIPVKWSELIVEPINWDEKIIYEGHPYLGIKQNYFGSLRYEYQDETRWVIKDAPAIHEEPFINSLNNYKQRIEMVFYPKSLGCDWAPLIEYLLNRSHYFGYPTKSVVFINQYIKEIKEKSTTDEELIRNVFEFVRDKMKWNEIERMFTTEESLQFMFKQGTGNSADINLLLYVMLKKLDFEVYPLIISTRENGVLLPTLPNLFKPNYVIVYLHGKEKDYFLDATDKYNPYDLIPERCLNGQGRIVDENKSTWVEIINIKKDSYKSVYDLALNENLVFEGTIKNIRKDYNACNFRKKYFSYNSKEEFLRAYMQERPGLDIIDCKMNNVDSVYQVVKDEYTVTISDFVTQVDSEIYIQPLLYEGMGQNPFNNEKRDLPIDFSYPREAAVMITIKIPDNYTVITVPVPTVIKLPDNSARCIFSTTVANNVITIAYQFFINKPIYLPNEYKLLQEYYSQIINKETESIILKLQ